MQVEILEWTGTGGLERLIDIHSQTRDRLDVRYGVPLRAMRVGQAPKLPDVEIVLSEIAAKRLAERAEFTASQLYLENVDRRLWPDGHPLEWPQLVERCRELRATAPAEVGSARPPGAGRA